MLSVQRRLALLIALLRYIDRDGRLCPNRWNEFGSADLRADEAAAPCDGFCYPAPVYGQPNTYVAGVIDDLRRGVAVTNGPPLRPASARSDVAVIVSDLLHDDDANSGSAAAFGRALASHIRDGRTVALVGVRSWLPPP